mgnify:CR=1 FL=1
MDKRIYLNYSLKLKALHNAPPLRYSEELGRIAQSWAEKMAQTKRIQHSPSNWRQLDGITL